MKKYLLALLLFAVVNANAQKIHITDSTNAWFSTGVDSNGNAFMTSYNYLPGEISFVSTPAYRSLQIGSNVVPNYGGIQFIREDTTAGIVYGYIGNIPSPIEIVLYNYNLHLGDTAHYSYYIGNTPTPYVDTTIVDSVIGIDSTLINGLYYKVFSLLEIDTFHIHIKGWDPYLTYIEGIGSVHDPVNAQYQAMYVGDTEFLQCFIDHAVTEIPPLVINVPFTFPVAGHTDTFINNCAFLGVPFGKFTMTEVTVQPNPIDEGTQIVFSQSIASGKLVVCNSVGQVVMNMTFQNKDAVTIGDKIKMPGIYFYEVMDNESGGVYRGEFAKE